MSVCLLLVFAFRFVFFYFSWEIVMIFGKGKGEREGGKGKRGHGVAFDLYNSRTVDSSEPVNHVNASKLLHMLRCHPAGFVGVS